MNLARIEEKLSILAELLDEKEDAISKTNEMIFELHQEKKGLIAEIKSLLNQRDELIK